MNFDGLTFCQQTRDTFDDIQYSYSSKKLFNIYLYMRRVEVSISYCVLELLKDICWDIIPGDIVIHHLDFCNMNATAKIFMEL